MLYLLDLPSDEVLDRLARRYPQLDLDAVKACVTLVRSSSDLLVAFEQSLERLGLSQGRFMVLAYMNRDPATACTPTQLAEVLNVSRATMTGLLDGLEAAGLIVRGIHSEDRRKMSVVLTDKGRAALDEMMPVYYAGIAEIMGGLSEQERRELRVLLGKVADGIRHLNLEKVRQAVSSAPG